jgi:hypothetical protein
VGIYLMNQYIFRFDIPVDDIVIMHELNCKTDLPDDTPHLLLCKPALLLEVIVDISAPAEFENQVEVVLVCEEGVELNDVGVV